MSKKYLVAPYFNKFIVQLKGNLGILFHKIVRHEGTHPEELCPCEKSVVIVGDTCKKICGAAGEFSTIEECFAELEKRKNPGGGGSGNEIYYYHAIATVEPLREPLFQGGIPPVNAFMMGFDLATEGNVFMVRSGSLPIAGYSSIQNKWFYYSDSQKIYVEWWNVEVIYVGVCRLFRVTNPNSNPTTILYVTDKANPYGSVAIFPVSGYGNGGMTGKLFLESFDYHYLKPRFSPNDPIVNVAAPPLPSTWHEIVPGFRELGTCNEWLRTKEEAIINQPQYYAPPIPKDHYYTIDYYLGGIATPKKLGSYLVIPQGDGRAESDTPCFTDQPEPSGQVEANMVTVGKGLFEVVISYGTFRKKKRYFGREYVNGAADKFDYYWCRKDVYSADGTKTTYKYPEQISLHENNWMKTYLGNWTVQENDKSPNEKLINSMWLKPENYYGMPVEHQYYLRGLLGQKADKYQNQFSENARITGIEAGLINISPYAASNYGVSFVGKSDTGEFYATDVDGHQFVNGTEFIEAIKTSAVENLPVKAGLIRLHFYLESNGAFFPVNSPLLNCRNLVFDQSKSGTITVPFVKSLEEKYCYIKQMAIWVEPDKIKINKNPMYGHIIKTSFAYPLGEGESKYIGNFTFSLNHTYENLFRHIKTAIASPNYIPFDKIDPRNNESDITNSPGWPDLSAYNLGNLHLYSEPHIRQMFPIQLKDEFGEVSSSINLHPSGIGGIFIQPPSMDNYGRQISRMGAVIVGLYKPKVGQ